MGGVRVVTDSACDLPGELASSLGIAVVPLTVRFGHDELLDRVQLTTEEFWRRCKEADALPETAAPAPGAFRSAFEDAAAQGADGILCITISSALSATYQSALAAAEEVRTGVPVRVIDTRSVSMGHGLMVLDAAERAASCESLDELASRVDAAVPRTRVYGALDTLDHLQRGGRIGGAAALIGSLLSIKPVIQIADGAVTQESRQRTRTRSLEHLAGRVREDAPLERLAVIDGAAGDIGVLVSMLEDVEVAHPLLVVELGPVVGTHTGPGTVGACYQTSASRTGAAE